MEPCYHTLSTIYEIVKSDQAPQTYLCTPHEIILRQTDDWTSVQQHLEILAAEKLITVKQLDKIVVSITPDGISKAKTLRNNFINNSFSFPGSNKESFTPKPEE